MSETGLPPDPTDVIPDRCVLAHGIFAKLGEVSFRPAQSDRTPVLIISLGSASAAVPLKALQSELGIENESVDGQMLALIAKALDFVGELRLGDALPVEVRGGGASWEPEPVHIQVALARLRLQVTTIFDDEADANAAAASAVWASADTARVLFAAAAPGMTLRLQAAHIELAATFGLPDVAAAAALLDEVAHELSFIEALRDRLLTRVQNLFDRADALSQLIVGNPSGIELISRVRRLSAIALQKIRGHFDELNELTGIVMVLLRELDTRRDAIQMHRDWLYCSLRGWEPILAEWTDLDAGWVDATWPLLNRTYRFLAPRFMPMQEWQLANRTRPRDARPARMVW